MKTEHEIVIDKKLFDTYPEIRPGLLRFRENVAQSDDNFWAYMDYGNTGLEVAVLIIGTAMISVVAEKVDKKIEKMKHQEEEELKDIV